MITNTFTNLRTLSLAFVMVAMLVVGVMLLPAQTQAEVVAEFGGETYSVLQDARPLTMSSGELSVAKQAERERLLELIAVLRLRISELLENQELTFEDNKQSFSVAQFKHTGKGIIVAEKGTEVSPYDGDGTDADDDSLMFKVTLEVTNTNLDESLLIDRSSVDIVAVDKQLSPVNVARTFGKQTGYSRKNTNYGFADDGQKLIQIMPGQTSTLILIQPFQFSEPGEYRALLESVVYSHDDVEFADDTMLFLTNRGYVYEFERSAADTLDINYKSTAVKTLFANTRFGDNKVNIEQYQDDYVSFDYPAEFGVEALIDGAGFEFEGTPYITVTSESDISSVFENVELQSEEITMINDSRVLERTYTFRHEGSAGSFVQISEVDGEEIFVYLFSYSAATASGVARFTAYDYTGLVINTLTFKQ